MNRMPAEEELRAADASGDSARATEDTDAHPPPVPRGRGRWIPRAIVALALLAGAVFVWQWLMATAPRHVPRAAPEKVEPVRVMTARLTEARPTWTLFGRAAAGRRLVLRMPVSGRVVNVAADLKPGRHVTRGETLVRVDDLPYRAAVKQAEAQIAETRAQKDELKAKLALERAATANAVEQLDIARRNLERARALFRRGVLSQSDLDARRTDYAAKNLLVAQHRANIAGLKGKLEALESTLVRLEWARRTAERNLADTILRAPLTGTVSEAKVEVGQEVSPSEALLTLVDDAGREVRIALSERRFGALRAAGERIVGRPVRVRWDTADGAVVLPGRVVRVDPAVREGQGSVILHVRIEDARKAAWLPDGAFVEARMQGPSRRNVALLPEAAVHDGQRVYVVTDGRMHGVSVRVVGHVGDKVAVSGLKGGEAVIVSRLAEPVEGRKVRILNGRKRDAALTPGGNSASAPVTAQNESGKRP